MLIYMKLLCFMSMLLAVNGMTEDGVDFRCDFNNSFFVQKGNDVTFTADIMPNYRIIRFYKGMTKTRMLLAADMFTSDGLNIQHIDDRLNVTITDERTISITLQDVTQDDRGMFIYKSPSHHCWELLVLDIWNPQNVTTFEESLPGYIDATPPASSMVRPRVNATATWLLDGLKFSQTTDFIEQDGRMIIMRIRRHLNAKNVTYRITEDNGSVHDVNLTLWVLYGPYSPLQLNPSRTNYIVTSGDVLPDITCSTDCNPPCEITWDRSGVRNVLSLGKIDTSSKGMYTCQATRNGTDRVLERSLFVEVNDETSLILSAAVTILGTMQDGPYSPLQLNPPGTSYIVTSGDVLPDITCSTDCNPPCEITWDRSGIGNVLSLGKVDKSSKGVYTCQATRKGTDHVIERSLYVEVNDETSLIRAVSILGTMHGIILVLLFVCTLCWYRTACLNGAIERTTEMMQNRTTTEQIQASNNSVEMVHYEGLDRSGNTAVKQYLE